MNATEDPRVESQATSEFARVMNPQVLAPFDAVERGTRPPHRLNLDPDKVKNGLGQLVLTLIKLVHELLERQAIRRMDSGSLSDDEIERLGFTLMRQAQQIERLREEFGLEEEDLNIDLGPLGKLL